MQVETRAACAYCQGAIEGNGTSACPNCRTTHHGDCWGENGGCAVLGCISGPDAAAASDPPSQTVDAAPAPLRYVDAATMLMPQAGPPLASTAGTQSVTATASPASHLAPSAEPQMPLQLSPMAPQPRPQMTQPASLPPGPDRQRPRRSRRAAVNWLAFIVVLVGVGAVAFQVGHETGVDEGFDRGFAQGEDKGFDHGWDTGYDNGWDEGWDAGYDGGWSDGWDTGYDSGVSCGVTTYYEWEC
jgi:hypothetical protein